MNLEPFGAIAPATAASIWNAACGPDLAISTRAVEYNTSPTTGGLQSGRVAFEDGKPVGFVLASMLLGDPVAASPQAGWLDAIAVLPEYQRRGIGGALLAWAESWLREHGATRVSLGASMRPFTPGLPSTLGDGAFFRQRGFAGRTGSRPRLGSRPRSARLRHAGLLLRRLATCRSALSGRARRRRFLASCAASFRAAGASSSRRT